MKRRLMTNGVSLGVLQGVIFLFLLVNYAVHDIPFVSVIKIFLFQFFCWFLTGFVLIRVLRIAVRSFTEMIALSYCFGGISAIIIYFLFMLPRLGFLLPGFAVIEGILCMIYLYVKKESISEHSVDVYGFVLCIAFLFVYLALSTCAVSFDNSMPNETVNGTGYYVDWPFWAGNNIAFTRSFPSDSFRQVGRVFKYHYFSSLLMAQVSLCTGVNINQISFYFSSLFGGLLLILSGYYFATRLLKRKWLIALTMIAVLFTDGYGVSRAWHTLICTLGFDYGQAYGMLALALLVEIIKNDRFKELFLPSCAALAMTVGCKGPIGVVVLASFGAASLIYMITKQVKRGVISGLGWLISFLAVYLCFIHDAWTTESSSGLQYIGGLGINTIVTSARWVAEIYNSLLLEFRIVGDHLLIKLYAIWLFLYRTDKAVTTLLLIAIGLVIYDLRRAKFDSFLYCFLASSLSGILLSIYTTQSGGSQVYFMEGMIPSAAMAGGYALERIIDEQQVKNRQAHCMAICIVFILTLGVSVNSYYDEISSKIVEGIDIVRDKTFFFDFGPYYADSIDYEAFDWMNSNTPKDAIIATDSHVDAYGKDNSMIMGLFSQRHIWNEYMYVFDHDEANRRERILAAVIADPNNNLSLIKEEGVDYLVCQVSVNEADYASQCNMLSEVFRNSHYVIYEIEQ